MLKILLFSGQGGQTPDMFDKIPETEKTAVIFKAAKDIFGFDVREFAKSYKNEGNICPAEMTKTINAQPLTLVYELAVFSEYFKGQDAPEKYNAVAGHSLGEYAALYAAGAVGLYDVLQLIKYRAEFMQKCAEENEENGEKGVMTAVILKPNGFQKFWEEIDPSLVVNHNSPEQIVISGTEKDISSAEEFLNLKECKSFVKRVVRLNTGGAFHTKYMKGAASEFFKVSHQAVYFPFFKSAKNPELFSYPLICPIYSNLTGNLLRFKGEDIVINGQIIEGQTHINLPTYLADHIINPVRFIDEVKQAFTDGFTEFVEIAPKETLTPFVKKILAANAEQFTANYFQIKI